MSIRTPREAIIVLICLWASAAGPALAQAPLPSVRPAARTAPLVERAQAWRELSGGRPGRALDLFTGASRHQVGDGQSRIGIALARAMLGDRNGAARGIRRVLRDDPGALQCLPPLTSLQPQLDELVVAFTADIACDGPDADRVVTLGALHLLRGDLVAARATDDLCRRLGRRTIAVVHLRRLIDEAPSPRDRVSPLGGLKPAPAVAARPASGAAASPPAPSGTAPDPEPAATLETAESSVPEPEGGRTIEPSMPREPIDFEQLRADLLSVSGALDRFAQKLIRSIERGGAPGGE